VATTRVPEEIFKLTLWIYPDYRKLESFKLARPCFLYFELTN